MRRLPSPSLKTVSTLACALALVSPFSIHSYAAEADTVKSEPFGHTKDGIAVEIYTLRNSAGCEARITNYGGIVVSLKVPDKKGHLDDVVMGFDKLDGYLTPAYAKNNPYFGALIGRYGNRIDKGRFVLEGNECRVGINNGNNSLHGGNVGFNQRVWSARPVVGTTGATLELHYVSMDGEEGFPGTLTTTAVYTLTEQNELKLQFTATTDKPTVVNLTNHSYFNLKGPGNGTILDHLLTIRGERFTPINAESIPTGELKLVKGTPFDFTQPTKIGQRIGDDDEQLKNGKGYDHNFVLDGYVPGSAPRVIARVEEPVSGRVLEVESDQPGVQFYTGNFLDGGLTGKGDKVYPYRGAFCLEPQHYPDTPNHPQWPSVMLCPGETYRHTIIFRFGVQS